MRFKLTIIDGFILSKVVMSITLLETRKFIFLKFLIIGRVKELTILNFTVSNKKTILAQNCRGQNATD